MGFLQSLRSDRYRIVLGGRQGRVAEVSFRSTIPEVEGIDRMASFRRRLLVASAVLLLLGPAPASAQSLSMPAPGATGQWRLVGQTQAKHGADHDLIIVQGPFANFRRIKFKVTNSPLNVQRMVVTYDSGMPDRIDVRLNIARGAESRIVDLRGAGQRNLRKIEFWYDSKGILNGQADVTVFGMK
jgi:hypothetical protein